MAGILLDVDGVLHVSGSAIAGAPEAVAQLRENGHRLRFVTNNTTHSRRRLAEQIRGFGVELEDDELQTTPVAAAHALAGKRVLALTMPDIIEDLGEVELARAFAELQAGAELYCLHKNRWWQTARGPLLDSGAFVAGLEYADQIEATVLGKPSPAYFTAALDALDSDPELTWMVGDDLEADIAGAQACGLRTVLVRTGKFRPDAVEASNIRPDGIITSIAALPGWIETAA
jgi:ribonucleotide monophosphatase NagD (HAD superfamily)